MCDDFLTNNIVLDITGLLSKPIDRKALIKEVGNAEKVHSFSRRTPVWLGIPLRSVNGETGEDAMKATGIANSPDPKMYKDTCAMQPYIRQIIDEIDAPVLKVRILKLRSKKGIGEHADNFQSGDIIRLHIPIITHPLVEFWLDGKQYYIPTKKLLYLNVRKRHKVINRSHLDRIHLVIDVKQTPQLIKRIKECSKIVQPV